MIARGRWQSLPSVRIPLAQKLVLTFPKTEQRGLCFHRFRAHPRQEKLGNGSERKADSRVGDDRQRIAPLGRIVKLTFEICLLANMGTSTRGTEICANHGFKFMTCEQVRKRSSLLSFSVNGRI
jgi:hypothetical protein